MAGISRYTDEQVREAVANARSISGALSKGPRNPCPQRRKVPRPSFAQLKEDVASMSFVAIGRKYGVTDNAVRKWIRWYEEAAAGGDP
jgi:transposase-like protein